MNSWKTILTVFLFFFCFNSFEAQDFPDKNQYSLFLDAKTQDIKIIENDSIIYTKNFQNPQKLKKGDFPENLMAYQYQFIINKKNYFVNDGCGVVLEYSNGELRRIDNSFLHKNQFAAANFQYKNEMYLFAGYGLFTDKNIITRYDFKAREWFLVPCINKVRPLNGSDYCKIVIGNNLYVFGGLKIKEIGIGSDKITPNTLWKFDLEKSEWKKLGEIDLKYELRLNNTYNKNTFNFEDKIYIFDNVYSAIIDLKKNKITYYKTKFIIGYTKVIYNPKDKTINFLDIKSSTRKTELASIPLSDFFDNPIDEETFYHQPFIAADGLSYLVMGISLSTIFLLFFYRTKKKKGSFIIRTGNEQEIAYQESKDQFIHNNSTINDFSPLEKSILTFLIKNVDAYIPIHSINFIIEQEAKTSSINTLLRKRESVLHLLKSKLSIMLNISFDEIILEQKNQEDRRIKEIKLNEKYFKIIK